MITGWSIRRRLVLTVSLITALIIAAAVFISLQINSATLRTQREAALLTENERMGLQLDALLTSLESPAQNLAGLLTQSASVSTDDLERFGQMFLAQHPEIAQLTVLIPNADDSYNQTQIRRDDTNVEQGIALPEETSLSGSLDAPAWSGQSSENGVWQRYRVSVTFEPFGSGQQGVVWADIDAMALRNAFDALLGAMPGERYHAVISRAGIVGAYGFPLSMADRTGSMPGDTSFAAQLNAMLGQMPDDNQTMMQTASPMASEADEQVLISRYNLTVEGWQLITILDQDLLQSPQSQSALFVVLIGIFGLAVLSLAIRNMARQWISEPLMEIATAAQEIGSGDMRYHIGHTDRTDEVGVLARALESMQQNLSDSYGRLSLYGRSLEQRVSERTKELEQARQAAQNNASEFRSLYDASIDIVSEYQLDVMLQKLIGYVNTLLRASYCSVWLLNEDSRQLKLVATTADQRHLIGVVVTSSEGLAGKVIRSRKALIVDDYTNWPGRIGWIMPQMHRALAVPLIYSGKSIGAIVVGRGPLDRRFDETEQRLLNLLGNIVSPIVRNAQLFGALEEAKKKTDLANEVKTRFLAGITHELRTPLNLVINNMDFMRIGVFGDVNDEQRSRLEQTIRSAEHLLYLINDLLDVSKIEAGEMQIFMQPTDVYPVLVDTLDSALALMPEECPVALIPEFPEQIPQVYMDARRIRQVLMNLLSNAIKFTRQGEIRFKVMLDSSMLHFSVTDTGSGIAQEDLEKIFRPFERASSSKQMGIEGTGLGLAITRFLVEAHGGTLKVETTVGKGSTFSFALPLNRSEEQHNTLITAKAPMA